MENTQTPAKKKLQIRFNLRSYSRLGFASFLLAIFSGLIVIADMTLGLHYQSDAGVIPTLQKLDVWLTWLAALLALAGIVLGIAAVAQKEKKRFFGLAGLVVNGLFLLGIVSLYIQDAAAFWIAAGR